MKRHLYFVTFWCLVMFGLALTAGCKKKGSVEILCGGLIDAQCSPTMYCHLNSGCGGVDREGVCKPRPARCPEEKAPVCGCDGKVYESPCYAALKGASVAYQGECEGDKGEEESIAEPLAGNEEGEPVRESEEQSELQDEQ